MVVAIVMDAVYNSMGWSDKGLKAGSAHCPETVYDAKGAMAKATVHYPASYIQRWAQYIPEDIPEML